MVRQGVVDILKGIVRTQVVIFAIAFCTIAAVAAFALLLQYRLTEEHDRELVRWHLADKAHMIQDIAVDYAFWDETHAMVMRGDKQGLERDVTGYLSKVHRLELVEVLDINGARVAPVEREDHHTYDFLKLFKPEVDAIVARRNDRVEGQKNIGGAVLWMMLGGKPHLVAMSPVYTTQQFESATLPEHMPWLVLAMDPDAKLLADMAKRYSLQNITLTRPGAGGFNNEFPIALRDGSSEVAIAWNSRPIGIAFARATIPLILASLLVLFGFGWRVIIRTQSVGRALDILHHETQAEQARLRSLFDNARDALVVHDMNGVVVDCNDRICAKLGLSRDVVIGMSIQDVIEGYSIENLNEMLGNTMPEGVVHRADGTAIPVEIRLGRFGQCEESQYIVSARDISERLKAEREIWHKAHHDALTDLPNRTLFGIELSAVLTRSVEAGVACALLYIDLDGFKAVNDTHGHDAGDELLREAAQRFRDHLRKDDVVARLGGDEFAVILPDIAKAEDVGRIADSLIAQLSQPYDLACGRLVVSASVGIALAPLDGRAPGVLLQAADRAMYVAKRADGGRYHLATDSEMAPDATAARDKR